MIFEDRLRELTGETVHGWHDWLVKEQCGCCHVAFAADEKYNWVVCMGWHDTGARASDGAQWRVAWKVGRESHMNAMQTDMDIDFEMPYDPETGDVDDTLEVLDPAPDTKAAWDELADRMRAQAMSTYNRWEEKEDE